MSINPFALAEPQDEGDLFGDDDGVVHAHAALTESHVESEPEDDGLGAEERKKRRALEYDEDDVDTEGRTLPGVTGNFSLPNVGVPRSSDGKFWLLKLPNYLKYEHRPFHPDTFQSLTDRDAGQGSSSADRSLSLKLELANTIRWKWTRQDDGTLAKQSNTRVIKWDDGSMSLQIGSEMYDIATTEEQAPVLSAESSQVAQESQSQFQSQSQSQSQPFGGSYAGSSIRSQGVSYIVTQHSDQKLLQVEAPITGQMSLRPVGTQSGVHLQLVRAVAQKHNKVSKLRFASDMMLAEAEREQEMLRKKGPKSLRPGMGGSGGGGIGGSSAESARRRRRISAQERRRRGGYSDDEDEDDYGDGYDRAAGVVSDRGRGAKGLEEYLEDEFVVADDSENEDGEAGGGRAGGGRNKAKSKKRADEDDEDEDGDGEEGGGGDAMDLLDEMDERIERERAARKNANEEDDMDEDDDEGNAVQKSFGKRRKHMVADSDEEE